MTVEHNKIPNTTNKGIFFNSLYEEYYPQLINYANQYIFDEVAAEDLVQELFVTIYNKNITFLSDIALKNFLYKSLRNSCLDYLKHREVENHYIDLYKNELYMEWESGMNEKIYKMVYREIDKLPSRCREIFLLHLDSLSNEEIAQKLSISIETVKTQKKKAMRLLREHFGKTNKEIFFFLLLFSPI